ncbi:MAG: tetratricopeptide repeat protein [Nitrospirota bacterium]
MKNGTVVIPALLIILLCLVTYSNTYQVPFQFDDPSNISENSIVRDLQAFASASTLSKPRSIAYLSFALNYRLHGTRVPGYHVVNLTVHIGASLLVYGIVMLLFRTPVMRQSTLQHRAKWIALFSALLFAAHPVQTQAVTYIVQRMASLAALLYLASFASYLKSRMPLGGSERAVIHPFWYGLSILTAVLAMKTKEIAFTLPVIIVFAELLFFKDRPLKRVMVLVPVLVTLFIIPFGMITAAGSTGDMVSDVSGAMRLQTDMSRKEYLFTEIAVVATYLRLLFYPAGQNLDHDYPTYHSFFVPEVILSFLLLALLAGAAVVMLYRDYRTSRPGTLTAFGTLFFFITLLVESSIMPIADVIFEHRLYLPSMGIFIAVTSALWAAADRIHSRWALAERLVLTVLTIAVLSSASLAYARNTVWQSEVKLWMDVVQKSPMKARAYNGLGLAFYHLQEYERAMAELSKAITLHPTYAVAFNNLGNTLHAYGRIERAIDMQTRAIELDGSNLVFYDNRGLSYAALGDHDRAIDDHLKAIDLDPTYAKARHNLGFALYAAGRYARAQEEYSRAVELDPGNAIFYYNRALCYAATGDHAKSLEDYNKGIAIAPDTVELYNGRGAVYGTLGRYDEAIADFTTALDRRPNYALSYLNRGILFARAGRRGPALSDFQQACERGIKEGCRNLENSSAPGR